MQAFSLENRCTHKDGSKVSRNKSTNTSHALTLRIYCHCESVFTCVCVYVSRGGPQETKLTQQNN